MGRRLPGYRFSPTDVELVMFYLKNKIIGRNDSYEPVAEVDIYNYHPRDLPGKYVSPTGDLEWYFLCPCRYGNTSSKRRNRATDDGFWKTTGEDKLICYGSRTVGMRKSLVFHNGRAPNAERTNWMIHEYRLEDPLIDSNFSQNSYVICKLFEKSGRGPKSDEKHGAPFKEEDWDEFDNDDDVVSADNNSADLISSVSSSERQHDHGHDYQSSFHPRGFDTIGFNQSSLNSFQSGPQEHPPVLSIERSLFHIDSEIPVPILSQSQELQHNQPSVQNPAFHPTDSQNAGENQNSPFETLEVSNYLDSARSLLHINSAFSVPVLYPELQHDQHSLQNPSFHPMDSRTARDNHISPNSCQIGSVELSSHFGTERGISHVDSAVPGPILCPEFQHDLSSPLSIDTSQNYLNNHDPGMIFYDDYTPRTINDCFTSNMGDCFTPENPLDCWGQLTNVLHVENETAMQQNLLEGSSSYIEMNDLGCLVENISSGLRTPPIPIAASSASRIYDKHIRNNFSSPSTTRDAHSMGGNKINEEALANGMNPSTGIPMFQPEGYNQ